MAAARVAPHENPTTYATRIIRALRLRTADATAEALERVRTDADFRAILIEWYDGQSDEGDEEVLRVWVVTTLKMEKELVV